MEMERHCSKSAASMRRQMPSSGARLGGLAADPRDLGLEALELLEVRAAPNRKMPLFQ
jgi:hypothetical protein